ncbi:MAG TPA: MFS transporter [Jatrophihabitantaceae bacterium]
MTTTTAATGPPVERSIFAPANRSTSVGLLILVTLIAFEAMAVAAALPTAARELHGIGAIGWAFTGFLVSDVVGMVVSGQLCDRRGPRLPMIAGLIAFLTGLVVAGTATSMAQLVAGRCVQGIGAGLLITAIYVVLGATYPDALRPKIFAAMSSAWVVPSLFGPVVSGTLAQHVSWRWVFLGLLPFVLVGAGLLVPVLRGLASPASPGRLADPHRVLHALAAAGGVAALEAAGQHPSPASLPVAGVGVVALAWGLRALLPSGTVRVRRGVSAPIAMRGLFAGAFFGVESMVPLTQSVQHGFGATLAGLPLVASGVTWALGSWWQGRSPAAEGPERRVVLIRTGFALIALAAALVAVAAQPAVPGWLIFPAWALAGLGAGLTMSSLGVLLLRYTNDADRGTDSAALQLSDAVTSALTTGVAGVLVAAAARGVVGYTAAFTVLDLAMVGVAGLGVAVAGRARPAASSLLVTQPAI